MNENNPKVIRRFAIPENENEWISCKIKLPRRWKNVEVMKWDGKIACAYRSITGISWVYPSGLTRFLDYDDSWRELK
jgi:hypothetical protein